MAFELLTNNDNRAARARLKVEDVAVKELKGQFVWGLLLILTAAAVVCAGINFQQQRKFRTPEDGVLWVDRPAGVIAVFVAPNSPAEKAGIREGDLLRTLAERPIARAVDVPQALANLPPWTRTAYVVARDKVELPATVILAERQPDDSLYYQYLVGAAYVFLGLFVAFRRGNASKALHFYVLCLASFVLFTFHYTGKLNNFDKAMYWGNVVAGVFVPVIFFHFALRFPAPRRWIQGFLRSSLLYLPALALLSLYVLAAAGVLRTSLSLIELRWTLDRLWLGFMCGVYLLGAVVLSLEYRKSKDPIQRQQLKWLRNGAVFGVAPFTLFYVVPFLAGVVPTSGMKLAVFSLALIPLTWTYAIVRYRLMDVDIIFQQGYVYTLSTLAVLGIVYALVVAFGNFDEISPGAVVILLLIGAFVFQPIRIYLQEVLDKYVFYRDRYDYRRTLIEFARELSSQPDMEVMMTSVADRLMRTLSLRQVAFFLSHDGSGEFSLAAGFGLVDRSGKEITPATRLDLSFLKDGIKRPYLFFERTQQFLDVVSKEQPVSVRNAIAELDLTYYFPCSVRGRTLAYIGTGRTQGGEFLTSDDVELLQTLSGYVGIAVENASLYRSLQSKAAEYERLKEYSENIVESINVGVLAVDLDNRIESWNSQIEKLTGITRDEAVGRRLEELFPSDMVSRLNGLSGDVGIHHLYKYSLEIPLCPENGTEVAHSNGSEGANGNGGGHANGNGLVAESRQEALLNVVIAPLVTRDMQQIGRLIICDDVTERAKLEDRLIQADKLSSVGILAAGVAHEVNTPLAVISTYAQMLAKQVSGDEQKAKLLDKIAKQTFRASEIVNSLLNFSRVPSTELIDLSLNQLTRETSVLVEHQLTRNGIKVEFDLEDGLPNIKGSGGKLQQVFLNLFLNARDAMDDGGRLRIRTFSQDEVVHVEVSDTGHGIAPEHLTRIYDPFFTTKSARKGTGLGLSVTYGIVREHGGSIEVDSTVGKGTTFHLEFPIARKPVNA